MTRKKTGSAAIPKRFVPCTLKRLPPLRVLEAAATAIGINPVNRPALQIGAGAARDVLPPERIALLTSKYWGAGGVKLGVAFLDGPAADLRARILSHMNAWSATANIHFAEASAGLAEVRIARTANDGYWSYLGTDILHIPAREPTMNLDSFTMQTPESEYHRVVRHETGHTLGFPHEHMRKEIVARLDVQKTITYFMASQGWSADEVQQQVLTPLEDTAIPQHTAPDVVSIMCYQLPGEITTDGQPIAGGLDIDPSDADFCGRIYPQSTPPVSPPPGPPVSGARHIVYFDFHQDVPANGLVYLPAFHAPVAIKKGRTELIYPAASGSTPAAAGNDHVSVSP